ncbi:hypothetical protein Tco_1119456, partial [Tanacetum coccineum]
SVAALQDLLKRNTLHVEVGVMVVATLPFIISYVSLTLEREGGGHTDSVTRPNLRTQHVAERFVVLPDSSHHCSTNAADDEVTSIGRSSMPPPPVLTAAVATTVIADATFAPAPTAGTEPVPRSIFRDSASTGEANQDVVGPSHPVSIELFTDSFFVSQDVDSETLHHTYVPKWNVTNDSALNDPDICRGVIDHLAPATLFSQLRNMDYKQLFVEFNVGAAHQTCISTEVRLRLEHKLTGRKRFEGKCAMQADWLKERDAEIASLRAHLSLKEVEAAEAISLCGQVATVEVAEALRVNELNSLKERTMALEGQVAALESATVIKDAELVSSNARVKHAFYRINHG